MPPKLSPVECASKGWINVALNTLQCQMYSLYRYVNYRCKAKVIVQINNTLAPNALEEVVDAYYHDLTSRHEKSCPWYGICGCEQITSPLTLPRTLLLEAFDKRLNSFSKCHVLECVWNEW